MALSHVVMACSLIARNIQNIRSAVVLHALASGAVGQQVVGKLARKHIAYRVLVLVITVVVDTGALKDALVRYMTYGVTYSTQLLGSGLLTTPALCIAVSAL